MRWNYFITMANWSIRLDWWTHHERMYIKSSPAHYAPKRRKKNQKWSDYVDLRSLCSLNSRYLLYKPHYNRTGHFSRYAFHFNLWVDMAHWHTHNTHLWTMNVPYATCCTRRNTFRSRFWIVLETCWWNRRYTQIHSLWFAECNLTEFLRK